MRNQILGAVEESRDASSSLQACRHDSGWVPDLHKFGRAADGLQRLAAVCPKPRTGPYVQLMMKLINWMFKVFPEGAAKLEFLIAKSALGGEERFRWRRGGVPTRGYKTGQGFLLFRS